MVDKHVAFIRVEAFLPVLKAEKTNEGTKSAAKYALSDAALLIRLSLGNYSV